MNRWTRIALSLALILSAASLGAEPSAADRGLLQAASEGNIEGMRLALYDMADPNAADENGNTALMMMAIKRLFGDERAIITELIEKKANLDQQNAGGMTALMYAAREDNHETVKTLLAAGAKHDVKDMDGWTAIMFASYNGSSQSFDELVAAKASVAIEDAEGWTPMMLALSNGKGTIVEKLQKAGAKVPTEFHGASTLFYAIESGDLTALRAVLAAGADVNGQDSDGWTPVSWATLGNQEQMVMELLRAGADPSIKNKEEKSALDYATQYELVELVAILGGEWTKPELKGTKVAVDCQALGGMVESWISTDETSLVVQTALPRPVSWYVGGGLTNRAKTSKKLTHEGVVAGSIHLDIDNDAKTGPKADAAHPGRKGAELTLAHSEFGTTVTYHYRTSQGEDRQRPVSANVIDVNVYKGDDMLDSDVWTDGYPGVYNDKGVMQTTVPLSGLGLTNGQKITVTTEFGKCVSKPVVVTLESPSVTPDE